MSVSASASLKVSAEATAAASASASVRLDDCKRVHSREHALEIGELAQRLRQMFGEIRLLHQRSDRVLRTSDKAKKRAQKLANERQSERKAGKRAY
eukprot:6194763-Pleurochrysis_carterae.AAC.3